MKKIIFALSIVGAVFALHTVSVRADESVGNKVQDTAGDASTGTKKEVRKAKRSVRKTTGNDTMGKDAKDKANDVKDDVNNSASKTERKMGN